MQKKLLAVLLAHRFGAVDSSFDPAAFAAGVQEGKGDTRRLQLPPKEYRASIVGPFGEDRKTKIRVEKGFVILDIVWQPDDPEVKAQLNVEKLPTVRQSCFLDVTPTNALDMGPFKNADLNKLREVFDLNGEGVQWKFSDFIGRVARIKIEQKANKDDPQNPYTNVVAVTKDA